MDPCGTPHLISCNYDLFLFNATNCFRFDKYGNFKYFQSYTPNSIHIQFLQQNTMVEGVKCFSEIKK